MKKRKINAISNVLILFLLYYSWLDLPDAAIPLIATLFNDFQRRKTMRVGCLKRRHVDEVSETTLVAVI